MLYISYFTNDSVAIQESGSTLVAASPYSRVEMTDLSLSARSAMIGLTERPRTESEPRCHDGRR